MKTKDKIIQKAVRLFAHQGVDGLSMRKLADRSGIAQSVIYHHFKNKDVLLKYLFDTTNTKLGKLRAKLPQTQTSSQMLKQRITFQIDHAEEIVAVLKYFLTYRKEFEKQNLGYVPEKAYLHIEEVLARGVKSGEFIEMDIAKEAKVITHAINGFILEYFPKKPTGKEKRELIESIHRFILRSIASNQPHRW